MASYAVLYGFLGLLLFSFALFPFFLGLAFGLSSDLSAIFSILFGGLSVLWVLLRSRDWLESSFRGPLTPISGMDVVFSQALFETGQMAPEVGGNLLQGFDLPEFFQIKDTSVWAVIYRFPGSTGTLVFSHGFLSRLDAAELKQTLRHCAERLQEPHLSVRTVGIALGCRLFKTFASTEWKRWMTEGSFSQADRKSVASSERMSREAISFSVRFALWSWIRKIARIEARRFEVEANPELYRAGRISGSSLPLAMREIHLFHPWPSERSDLLSG